MARMLFSELHPWAYQISVWKMRGLRFVHNRKSTTSFAGERVPGLLPAVVYRHNSLIRRRLGNVDAVLQDNKAVSLALAAPKVSNVLIRPGQTFSFWELVGPVNARRGYRNGVVISNGKAASGVGGGMCQFTNQLHWMVLHSPLDVVEHHHHSAYDLFPDFNRQSPYGTGTSIVYNYLDYRFRNNTDQAFQVVVSLTAEHLRGELRAERALPMKYHVREEDAYFYREGPDVYRHNRIIRTATDKRSGNSVLREELLENNGLVCYPTELIKAPILESAPARNAGLITR